MTIKRAKGEPTTKLFFRNEVVISQGARLQATSSYSVLHIIRNLLCKGNPLTAPASARHAATVGPTRGGRCPANQQRVRSPVCLLPCTLNLPLANTHLVLDEGLFSCLRRQEEAYAAEPIKTSEYG